MSFEDTLHIVIAVHLGWGHVRPLCALAAQLVKLRNVNITFFTGCEIYDKVVEEISRNFEDGEEMLQQRIRIIGLLSNEQNMFDQEAIDKSFEEQWQKILAAQSAFCSSKQKDIPALKPPHAVILDMFGYHFFKTVRKSSSSVKVLVSLPASILSMYVQTGPFGANTQGELDRRVQDYMQKTGKPFLEAAQFVVTGASDEIIQGPGLPPMYNYENHPQELAVKIPVVGEMIISAANLLHECNGLIACTIACIEPKEAIQAFSDFFALTSRKIHIVGPLVPLTKRSGEAEQKRTAKSPEIAEFMLNALRTHGERSMIYISFGTFFWPNRPEKVWAFLDVLIEKRIPFIMAQASPLRHFPDDVAKKVEASGTGLITTWAPQQAILEHPVTGWFLTHGGYNSIIESIHSGIPMICWPFDADQPLNTIHLTENLDVAYELLEVRTGDGLKPIYRTGRTPTGTLEAVRAEAGAVLEKAFGEDGSRKRENIRKLKQTALCLWNEDGEARVAAKELLSSLTA